MVISSNYDRHDSCMTVQKINCHSLNCYSHKELLPPHDRYDRILNFSAEHVNFSGFERDKSVGIEKEKKHTKGFEKAVITVISVISNLQLITKQAIKGLTACPEDCHGSVMQVSELSYRRRNPMKKRFFYGTEPKLCENDKPRFSRGNCVCKHLFQTLKGAPVAISQNSENGIWQVEYGFSCVVFQTEDDALAFCKKRFCDLDGNRLYRSAT